MKNYCHIWNQLPRIYQNAKFCTKIKILKERKNLKKLMSYLKSAPSSLSKYQQSSKTTTTIIATTKNKTKNVLFGYFVLWVWKTIVIIWNQHSRICRHAKNCSKQKKSKFGTKNVLFGHFGLQVWKAIDVFEISSLEFIKMQSFVEK